MRKSVFWMVVIALFTQPVFAQKAGGVAPGGSSYKLLRSLSGSKGSEQSGRFHISDPRGTFYLPADKNVIVYMEWEGPAGSHTFEAYWRNPSGKVTVVSDFKYDLPPKEKRYAGYMELLLNPTMPTGVWSMEARIDGEVLGTHSFEVISADKPTLAEDHRRALGLAEIYKRAQDATVMIERLASDGRVVGVGSAFFLDDGTLITAFQNIDGANKLRARLPDGGLSPVDGIVGWDRWQDWAALKVTLVPKGNLPRAKENTFAVGDRCMTLSIDQTGSRSIVDAAIIGKQQLPHAGERLKIASSLRNEAIGSPVVNEYGEVVGIVGGSLFPGANVLPASEYGSGYPANLYNSGIFAAAEYAIPITNLPATFKAPVNYSDLQRGSQIVPPVARTVRIGRGTIAKSINKKSPLETIEEGFAFSRYNTPGLIVHLLWSPVEKLKGLSLMRVYNADGHQVMESLPGKMDFKPGVSFVSTWDIPARSLSPDFYRVDVSINNQTVWRTFFKITD
jgi:S1-C subfamily serine protease